MDGVWLKTWIFLAVLCGLSVSRGSSSHQTNGHRSQICRRAKSPNLRTQTVGGGHTAHLRAQSARDGHTEGHMGGQTIDLADHYSKEHAIAKLECLTPESLVRVNVHRIGKRFHVTIQACKNVRKVLLHLHSRHFFKKDRPRRQIVDCSKVRDTLVISRPAKHQVVTISTFRHSGLDDPLSLSWTFQYLVRPNITQWDYKDADGDEAGTQMSSAAEPERPVARDKRSNLEVEEPKPHKPETKLEDCGEKRTCVRFGSEECQHMECDYLLSYTVTNHTFLELELSGKTDGWIALGLSSDDKMGGTDVILCKRKSGLTREIQALSMWIDLPHTRPSNKDTNPLTPVSLKMENGFLYCKVTRYIGGAVVVDEKNLDLTNNWFQLYAVGDIDRTGTILQHDVKPPTSTKTLTMLRPFYTYKSLYASAAPSLRSMQVLTALFLPAVIKFLV